MIEVSGLTKTYPMGDVTVNALKGVSLKIEPGEFVAIMGPSGSGKSTLMHVLGLLDVPDTGSYKLFGQEVSKLSEDGLAAVRRKTIGFVFQQFNLLSRTSALENVALPLLYSTNEPDLDLAQHYLEEVGLGSRLEHKPNELSGGQQQRVAIARALVNEPAIIFADEPTGNLDSQSEKEIMGILTALNDKGITVILVSHEPEIANYAKRIIRMRDGVVQSDEWVKPKPESKQASETQAGKSAAARKWLSWDEFEAHFTQGIRSLLANKVRSALSMLGILIGVSAVITMLAIGKGAQESIEKQLASLGSNLLVLKPGAVKTKGVTGDAGGVARFTMEDAREISQGISSVKKVAPSVGGKVQVTYGDKNWNTSVQGTVADYPIMHASEPILGRFFSEDENTARARVAVLGTTLVHELFGDESPIGEMIRINKVAFLVIGVLPEKGANGFKDQDDVIMIPVQTAMHRLLGKPYVDSIDIQIGSQAEMPAAEESIRDIIIKRHRLVTQAQVASVQVRNMAELQDALSETSRTMSLLLASIAAISLLVGGIGIMNIMLVSVTERTREIGLRKAVGARRRDILAQFLIEAMVVTLMGGLVGIALGWAATTMLSQLAGWSAHIAWDAVALATLFSAGIGVTFGLWPARKASLLSPIEALRHE